MQPLNQFVLLFLITSSSSDVESEEQEGKLSIRETLEFVVLFLDSLLSRKVLQCLKLPITGRNYWNVLVNSNPPCWHLISTSGQAPVLCKDKLSRMF